MAQFIGGVVRVLQTFLIFSSLAPIALAAGIEHVAGGPDGGIGRRAHELKLVEPFAVDFDRKGDWYICEYKGQRVVRVNGNGATFLAAGTGTAGDSGDGGPAAEAKLRDPHGIAITRSGQMYIADTLNHRVRRVDLKSGHIHQVAGTGSAGFSGDGGPAKDAAFNGTFAVALSPDDRTLYVADLNNRRVRALDLQAGVVRTIAGNGESGVPRDGGLAAQSPLVDPRAVAADRNGNLYILERRGDALRRVDREGRIVTLIGPGTLNGPKHLTVDGKGRVVIADSENHLIRRYDPTTRQLTVIAGTGKRGSRISSTDPLATELNRPHGVAFDRRGRLYISDSYNHRVLRLTE